MVKARLAIIQRDGAYLYRVTLMPLQIDIDVEVMQLAGTYGKKGNQLTVIRIA